MTAHSRFHDHEPHTSQDMETEVRIPLGDIDALDGAIYVTDKAYAVVRTHGGSTSVLTVDEVTVGKWSASDFTEYREYAPGKWLPDPNSMMREIYREISDYLLKRTDGKPSMAEEAVVEARRGY